MVQLFPVFDPGNEKQLISESKPVIFSFAISLDYLDGAVFLKS